MALSTPIEIQYITDPFSCWSWCNEPRVRKLQEEFGNQLRWTYVMGGLLVRPDEATPERLAEIAEDWADLQRDQGMPTNPQLWTEHPPQTTLLACQAVKAAELQSPDTAQLLLRRLREAAMTENNPLQTVDQILAAAQTAPGVDSRQLKQDLEAPAVKQALQSDLALARSPLPQAEEVKDIGNGERRYAFPTMIMQYGDDLRVISPFPPYDKYVRALQELKPDIVRHNVPPLEAVLAKYQKLTTKEIEVLYNWSRRQALEQLETLWEERKLQKQAVGDDYFWLASSLVTA